jgi:hypothetical protein
VGRKPAGIPFTTAGRRRVMRKKVTTFIAAAALMVFGAIPAMAAPADGTCVAKGVANLDGPTIAAAANGTLFGSNVVDDVILDHVFNAAKGIGSITGANC